MYYGICLLNFPNFPNSPNRSSSLQVLTSNMSPPSSSQTCAQLSVYPPRGTNSWNTKDSLGLTILFLGLGALLLVILCVCMWCGPLSVSSPWVLIVTTLLYIGLLVGLLYHYPIAGLYAISAPVTLVTRTPHRLPVSSYFPSHIHFERAWPRLRREYDRFLQRHPRTELPFTKDSYNQYNAKIGGDTNTTTNRGWRIVDLKLGDQTTSVCRHYFPTLTALLEDHPYIVSCVLSVLDGRTRIPEHVGYSKYVMRYMLPLEVPKGDVRLCVNGDTLRWTEGKSVLWDDTFPHMVFNHTDEPRAVLYMDVLRYRWTAPVFRTLLKHTSVIQDEIRRTEMLVPV